jgi:beta-glucosidase/6-phospho-beta-glucosidase/beta-galactosidase
MARNRRSLPPLALPAGSDFIWAAGIEDTFVSVPHPRTGRILDEYALTEHYQRWEEDLRLLADLGVNAARYGFPWYRLNPARGVYDWSWSDAVLEKLVNTYEIEPIVDLVHYGAPLWMERSFLDPDYPQHISEYAHEFAERYRGLCFWYTPLNEPRINAWYAGRLGWWPPYGRSWKDFARVLVQLCRGIGLTQRAIAEVEPNAVFVHVDASDLYLPDDSADSGLVEASRLRQEIVYLGLDLVTGRVTGGHPLVEWIARHGIADSDLQWFAENAVTPDVVGFNMYPTFSRKVVRRSRQGGMRVTIRPGWTETLEEIARDYARRYHPLPVMITETASAGTMRRRIRWIEDSAKSVRKMREEGIPLIGYTFWPLFSLVTWAYQRGVRPLEEHLLPMGLWDLISGPSGLERIPTPAVAAFKRVIRPK